MFEDVVMKQDYIEKDINLYMGLTTYLCKKKGIYSPYALKIFSVQEDPVKSAYKVLYTIYEIGVDPNV